MQWEKNAYKYTNSLCGPTMSDQILSIVFGLVNSDPLELAPFDYHQKDLEF